MRREHASQGKKITILVIAIWSITIENSSAQDLAPQFWTNLVISGQIDNKWFVRFSTEYNTIFNQSFKWRELGFTPAADLRLSPKSSLNGSFNASLVNQKETLNSFEIRPSIGYRYSFFLSKSYNLINLTRLQGRFFSYSDNTNNLTGRVRNKTDFIKSINRDNLLERSNWVFQTGVEVFLNFDGNTRERFLDLFRANMGITYIFPTDLTMVLNILFQESKNNLEKDGPTSLPVNPPETRFIFEYTLVYRMW